MCNICNSQPFVVTINVAGVITKYKATSMNEAAQIIGRLVDAGFPCNIKKIKAAPAGRQRSPNHIEL